LKIQFNLQLILTHQFGALGADVQWTPGSCGTAVHHHLCLHYNYLTDLKNLKIPPENNIIK